MEQYLRNVLNCGFAIRFEQTLPVGTRIALTIVNVHQERILSNHWLGSSFDVNHTYPSLNELGDHRYEMLNGLAIRSGVLPAGS